MTKPTHQVLIAFTESALDDLRGLSSQVRMSVFRKLRSLLRCDNPLGVSGIKKIKGSAGQYRARSGDFFNLEVHPTEHLETTYKGTLIVSGIKHRSTAYRP